MPNSEGRIWQLSNLVVRVFAMNGITFFDQGSISGLCNLTFVIQDWQQSLTWLNEERKKSVLQSQQTALSYSFNCLLTVLTVLSHLSPHWNLKLIIWLLHVHVFQNVKSYKQTKPWAFLKCFLTELINPSTDNSHPTEGQQFSCYHNRISSDFAVLQIQILPVNC